MAAHEVSNHSDHRIGIIRRRIKSAPAVRGKAALLPFPCLALYQTRRVAWNERSCEEPKSRATRKAQSKLSHVSNTFVGKHQAKFGVSLSYLSVCFLCHSLISPVSPLCPISEPTLSCEFREHFVVQQLRSTASSVT
jgi:hypothetical protein